jgi:hypothetical protein
MAYAESTELARILKIRTPSTEQTAALERCLDAATQEIDSFIDLPADAVLEPGQVAIAEQVCLERARELWQLQEVQLGFLVGELTGEASRIAQDTWKKHSVTLWPLKGQWGFA